MLVTLRVRTKLKQDTTEDCKVHKVAKQFFFSFLRNKMLHQQNNVVYESKFYQRKKKCMVVVHVKFITPSKVKVGVKTIVIRL